MITELTQEQIDKFPQYVEEFTRLGLSTHRADKKVSEQLINKIYAEAGLSAPKDILWFDSPYGAIKYIKEVLKQTSWSPVYGSHNAAWYSRLEFFRREFGIKECEKLKHHVELAWQISWYFPYDNLCLVCENPTEIHMDMNKLIHNPSDLAIKHADGWGVAAFHGVRIPKEWVRGKLPSAQEAITWPNVEQRRAACELVGWKSILSRLNAKIIDEDRDPMIGKLLQVDLPESPEEKFLHVICGTGREFVLPVPKDMKTALEANAWTYNISPDMLTNGFVRT